MTTTDTSHTDLAIHLFEHWPAMNADEIAALFTDDAVYINIPFPGRQVGGDAVAAVLKGPWMGEKVALVEPRVVSCAAQGDLVFVERVERFTPKSGEPFELPVVGVIRVRDGKICEWRDYFDSGQWKL